MLQAVSLAYICGWFDISPLHRIIISQIIQIVFESENVCHEFWCKPAFYFEYFCWYYFNISFINCIFFREIHEKRDSVVSLRARLFNPFILVIKLSIETFRLVDNSWVETWEKFLFNFLLDVYTCTSWLGQVYIRSIIKSIYSDCFACTTKFTYKMSRIFWRRSHHIKHYSNISSIIRTNRRKQFIR